MSVISVKNLKKYYQVHKKEPGLKGSIKSLFHREYKDVKAVNNISFSILYPIMVIYLTIKILYEILYIYLYYCNYSYFG